jgi:Na+-translocating ferredoxin:NAD+ oxidoreductase RnfG subunit
MVTTLTAGLRDETESLIYDYYGDSVSVLFKKITIPKEIKLHAEKNARLRFLQNQVYIWEITQNDSLVGLAYLDNVKGKSQPITFAVFYNSQGKVARSHIIKYREPVGGEVSNQYWLKQFFGKWAQSNYKVGKDIDGISGATISVNAVTRGIHRSTFVADYFLKKHHE